MSWTALAAAVAAALAAIPGTSDGLADRATTLGNPTPSTQARQIPANAFAVGDRWVCDDGYRKVDGACQKIDVPANATAIGASWHCNTGYRKVSGECVEIEVPENAHSTFLLYWACDSGYRRVGEECQKVDIPDNAFPIGSEWACNFGYRRRDEQCAPMPEAEVQKEVDRLRALAPRDSDLTPEVLWKLWAVGGLRTADRPSPTPPARVGMYDFSLGDVEHCRVYRVSDGYGKVECLTRFGPNELERSLQFYMAMRTCGARLSGPNAAELVCADPQLAIVQARCRVIMSGGSAGRIRCR